MNLHPHELQAFLRQFAPLAGVEVGYESDIKAQIAPHVCRIRGGVNIHGDYHVWDAEVNLTQFDSADDLLLLVKSILQAFDKAAHQHADQTH